MTIMQGGYGGEHKAIDISPWKKEHISIWEH